MYDAATTTLAKYVHVGWDFLSNIFEEIGQRICPLLFFDLMYDQS